MARRYSCNLTEGLRRATQTSVPLNLHYFVFALSIGVSKIVASGFKKISAGTVRRLAHLQSNLTLRSPDVLTLRSRCHAHRCRRPRTWRLHSLTAVWRRSGVLSCSPSLPFAGVAARLGAARCFSLPSKGSSAAVSCQHIPPLFSRPLCYELRGSIDQSAIRLQTSYTSIAAGAEDRLARLRGGAGWVQYQNLFPVEGVFSQR